VITIAQRSGAQSLVDRARLGDQNARATISVVRDNAKRGDQTAKDGLRAIKEYIARNPVVDNSGIAGDEAETLGMLKWHVEHGDNASITLPYLAYISEMGHEPMNVAAYILASGPAITFERVSEFAGRLPHGKPHYHRLFGFGINYCRLPPEDIAEEAALHYPGENFILPVLCSGQIIGRARNLQMVRLPQTLIGPFSQDAAWEMGE
jgi:hypothetical protein